MSQQAESAIIETWLRERLAGDATLAAYVGGTIDPRIYGYLAPQDAAVPLIVYQFQQAPEDVKVVGGWRILVQPEYVVQAIDAAESFGGTLTAIANRVEALIGRQGGTAAAGTVDYCERVAEVKYVELEAGRQYRHMGARYRVWVSAAG